MPLWVGDIKILHYDDDDEYPVFEGDVASDEPF
jgi:hypothetical protein